MKQTEKPRKAQKQHRRTPAKPNNLVELTEQDLKQVQGGQSAAMESNTLQHEGARRTK